MELGYSGNRSEDAMLRGPLSNLNLIPAGAFFKPDPKTGVINDPSASGFTPNDYYPLPQYTGMQLTTHGSYARYNALIATWQKQTGRVTFTANYTFSKVLGIRDNQSDNGNGDGNTLDPFNITNNYGVLAYDHTHIFNAAYVINLPSPVHDNKVLGGVANGWTLSGITQLQSGPPLQPLTNGNMNVTYPGSYTSQIELGTTAYPSLVPRLTCDPRSGLSSGQYFNPSCFAPPVAGQQGNYIWPYIKGPAFFNSDLAIYKNFKFKEHQDVQFRFSAFNFLNHPLPQFDANGSNNDVKLNLSSGSGVNSNPLTTGYVANTVGRRVVEFALKYSF
jgi:hypothetical protein